jgi:hypothetical protein
LAELLQVSMAELDRLLNPGDTPEVASHEVAKWLSHYDSLVQRAGRSQQVETVAVPALLQTESYANSMEQLGYRHLSPAAVVQVVEGRLARQAVLWRQADPLELSTLIDELVLMNAVGGSEVMAEQLEHLVEMAEHPNIDLRLIPADGRAICCRGGLELLTKVGETIPFMAVTVDIDGPRYEERPELTSRFVEIFDHAASHDPACIRVLPAQAPGRSPSQIGVFPGPAAGAKDAG